MLTLLSDPDVGWLVVEHRDRLARFGVGMVDAMLRARGGGLIVVDETEVDDDLVRDMTEIMTSFCARCLRSSLRSQPCQACIGGGG